MVKPAYVKLGEATLLGIDTKRARQLDELFIKQDTYHY